MEKITNLYDTVIGLTCFYGSAPPPPPQSEPNLKSEYLVWPLKHQIIMYGNTKYSPN